MLLSIILSIHIAFLDLFLKSIGSLGFSLTQHGNIAYFCLFRGHQKRLTFIYSGGQSQIKNQSIYLKNDIAQLYFI